MVRQTTTATKPVTHHHQHLPMTGTNPELATSFMTYRKQHTTNPFFPFAQSRRSSFASSFSSEQCLFLFYSMGVQGGGVVGKGPLCQQQYSGIITLSFFFLSNYPQVDSHIRRSLILSPSRSVSSSLLEARVGEQQKPQQHIHLEISRTIPFFFFSFVEITCLLFVYLLFFSLLPCRAE